MKVEKVEMELDSICGMCEGSGNMSGATPCPYCNGSGYRLTEVGESILLFLQRHLGIRPTGKKESE